MMKKKSQIFFFLLPIVRPSSPLSSYSRLRNSKKGGKKNYAENERRRKKNAIDNLFILPKKYTQYHVDKTCLTIRKSYANRRENNSLAKIASMSRKLIKNSAESQADEG